MTNRKIEYWVIPPEADAEFVAHMEEVLETYERPYDPNVPVLCWPRGGPLMDGHPVQLLKETRLPIAATAEHARRVDYERAGTAVIFMFAEPLAGWREVAVREQKTKTDWAIEMAQLLEGRYAACTQVILVCDNLNTHTKGAFYEAFQPIRARDLVRRIEFCYTPKHGSKWPAGAMAEYRRKRTQFVNAPMRLGSPLPRHSDLAKGNRGLVYRCQRHPARR